MRNELEIENIYNIWLENIKDKDMRNELEQMTDIQKKESFGQDIAFGTGGLRGIIGAGSNKMNEVTVKRVTLGFVNYLNMKYPNKENKKIAISRDPRHKSEEFVNLIISILAKYNIKSLVYDDIKPTPMLSYLVRKENCDGGIMITASHNPKEYNGYKVYNIHGAQLNLDESEEMIAEVEKLDFNFDNNDINLSKIKNDGLLEYINSDFDSKYLEDIDNVIKDKTIEKDVKIVYSPLHGTGYKIVPKALRYFGFKNIIEVKEQSIPDGNFSNTTCTNPEDISAYDLALEYAKREDADVIILNDPDADRLGIMFKNQQGEYIFQTGNQTGTLLIYYLLNRDNITSGTIFKTIVTGDLSKKIANSKGVEVQETLTGFKFIGDMIENNPKKDFIFGYEESYGYLINECVRDKDSIQSSSLIAEMVQYYKDQNKTLDQVMDEVYSTYGYSYEITNSLVFKGLEGMNKIKKVMEYYKKTEISRFLDFNVSQKIDFNLGYEHIPKSDVIKFYLEDMGWIVFRPSGTEPKLKVYFSITTDSIEKSKEIINSIYKHVLKTIDSI